MSITLAMYDILKIQEFIFSSNKLKENLGASLMVQTLLSDDLSHIIEEETEGQCCTTDWKKGQNSVFKMLSGADKKLQAEVIYSGGGNAFVAYRDQDIARKVTKALSRHLVDKTGGALQVAVAYHDTDLSDSPDYQEDINALFRQLKLNKYQMVRTTPLLGIGITRQGLGDGWPAVYSATTNGKTEYLSRATEWKRKTEETKRTSFDDLLPEESEYMFPRDLDYLGQKKQEENYLAVVHIDGNNMGACVKQLLKDAEKDYETAIKRVRTFSIEVHERYTAIMRKLVKRLIDGLKEPSFYERFALTYEESQDQEDNRKRYHLPIRPVVLGGDDVTFLCDGRLGVPLAELFLTELQSDPTLNIDGQVVTLSACAGVAIVKTHFPFYRAYPLAEELCKSAKMKAKVLAEQPDNIGNWLDFHIIQSGITTNLKELRQRFYQIPSLEANWQPPPLLEPDDERSGMKYDRYHLLWRPWCVAGDSEEQYKWEEFKENIYQEFTRTAKRQPGEVLWNRSRLKRLRNTVITSKEQIEQLLKEFQSRGLVLPKFLGKSDFFYEKSRQTPYFDALELLDLYLTIPGTEGGHTI